MALILVVDDHPGMASAVAALVRSDGHESAVAHGGAEALALIRARPVDGVVLDVMMPGMSGLDVLREVRAGRAGRNPVVIMFSGNAGYRDEAMRSGADAFVSKVEAEKLLDLVAEHLPTGAA
jgi:CheY-like chemotaxis protein